MPTIKDLAIQRDEANDTTKHILVTEHSKVTIIDAPAPTGQPELKPHERIDVKVSRGPHGSHKSVEPAARISLVGGRPRVMRDTNHDQVLWLDRVLSIGGQKTFRQIGIHINDDNAIRLALDLLENICSTYPVKFFGVAPMQDADGNQLSEEERDKIALRRIGTFKAMIEFMRKEIDKADRHMVRDFASDYTPGF